MNPSVPGRYLVAGKFRLALDRTLVMGIVNATPDSFADQGRHAASASAIAHARQLIAQGADIIDLGGESTRPGASVVDQEEELRRIIPVLEQLVDAPTPICVDTRKPAVMRRAIALGAAMINDVNALRAPGAIEALAETGAAVCLMHMLGEPATMQRSPLYRDVVREVREFLQERVAACRAAGIALDRIVVDPGFGFGKSPAHNLALLRGLREFEAIGAPVLAGLSRKGTLGALTGRPIGERMPASIAAALAAVARGAAIVRVHDVAATVDALKVWQAVEGVEHKALHKPG